MYAFWNNKKYKILDKIQITNSSREVTYSDLTIDFSECSMEDLPLAQQEIQIYDNDDNLKFDGFLSDYELPKLTKIVTPEKELTLSLYSPREMTTKRTVTINRTCKLSEAIRQTLSPMFEDGFTLTEMNISDKSVTVSLISNTVEEVMDYFSNKYELWWNIDDFKNITVNSIDYLFSQPIKKDINIDNYKEEIKGLISLTPSVSTTDYANIINIKNARIFYTYEEDMDVELEEGDTIEFENPIDISLATAERVEGDAYTNGVYAYIQNLNITYEEGKTTTSAGIVSWLNSDGGDGQTITDTGTDDSDDNLFVLTMDSMFSNLATGFTYKGEDTITVTRIYSQTALKYANMKLINWDQINELANTITTSGQIEKVVDVEEGWYTVQELIDYIRSLFTVNDKYTSEITLEYDEENDIELGDRITIELPEYFIEGNYIVTDIEESTEGANPTQYSVSLRNTNLTENFIDLFRSSSDSEDQTSQIEAEYVVEYNEGEGILETHEYDFHGSEDNHTLNFTLNK